MSDAPQKAVLYTRVSSDDQAINGHGLESQESRCRQFALSRGYEVVAVFPDTITGGGDYMQRPGMMALLAFLDAQPGERFVIVFDDLKRASRDTRAFLNLRDAFRERDARVESPNFKFDDSPEGEFIETIIAAQGQLERKQKPSIMPTTCARHAAAPHKASLCAATRSTARSKTTCAR